MGEISNETSSYFIYERGIKSSTLKRFKISSSGDDIVIPVFDIDGNFLFNKYRRGPRSKAEMKYWYDKGSKVSLFNSSCLGILTSSVVICEGEIDCMTLVQNGIPAVSSTGGCGSFLQEWAPLFNGKNVLIIMDRDFSGRKGAIRVQKMIPGSLIFEIPSKFNASDVNEFWVRYSNVFIKEILNGKKIGVEWSATQTLSGCSKLSDRVLSVARSEFGGVKPESIMDSILQEIKQTSDRLRVSKKRRVSSSSVSHHPVDKISRAKEYDIRDIIKFNGSMYANCIWHEEKTPSMFYFQKQNRVYCFGCKKSGDSIDVYMRVHGTDFISSIEKLSNNP